jgi:hypothetical protein
MTDQITYDQQFWQTVERVAAQVASAASNGAAAGGKSLAPAPRPAAPPQANGQGNGQTNPGDIAAAIPTASGGVTAGPARPSGGTEPVGAATMPATSIPSGNGADGAEQKWIGAALSIAASLAPAVIDAFRKRRKDFTPDGPDAEEKLLGTVTEVVTPAIIDAITRSSKDFAPDGDDADAKGLWGAVARVVASAVPSIIGEVFRRKDFAPELAADATADDDKGPALVAGAVTPAVIEAIARQQQSSGASSANGAAGGDEKGIPWGAVARVAASVVPAVVGEITRKKIYAPGMQPLVPPGFVRVTGNAADGDGRRYAVY